MDHPFAFGALAFLLAAGFQGCAQGSPPAPIDFSADSGGDDEGSGSGSGLGNSSDGSSSGEGASNSSGASSSGSGSGSSGGDGAVPCGDLYRPCCNGAYCAVNLTCSPNLVCITDGSGDAGSGTDGANVVDSGPTCAPGLMLCNGVCTDTSSNQANCGTCGHVCQLTTCTNGACDSVVLSSGFVPPGRLAIDANAAYWTNGDGTIRSVPLAGGATTTLATGLSNPMGIAVDAQNVYAASQDGRIVSVPLAGAMTPDVLATMQPNPYALAIDTNSVYWTNVASAAGNGSVMTCAKSGCGQMPTTLASGLHVQNPFGIAVVGGNVLWTSLDYGGEVNGVPTTGGTMTTIVPNMGLPYELAASGSTVLAVLYGNGGAVASVPLGGGASIDVVGGQSFPTELATDGTDAYWTLTMPSGENGASLVRAPLATGQAEVIAKNMQPAGSVQVDSQYVYWLSNEGALRKLPK